jgi:hypothetical protein
MVPQQYRRSVILLLLIAFFIPTANAQILASIIIDDLGNNLEYGNRVIDLPGPVTLAFLPHTEFTPELADRAHQSGKEIMLHLPLQSVSHHSHTPGTLKLHMTHSEFVRQLERNIDSIPHIKGINNHMGSLLTRHPGHMDWLMTALAARGNLYFVDSKTTSKSVAPLFARKHDVPHLDRDIFLDPDPGFETIRREFEDLLANGWITTGMLYRLNGLIELVDREKKVLETGRASINAMACLKWRAMLSYSAQRNIAASVKDKQKKKEIIAAVTPKLAAWLDKFKGNLRIPLWNLLYNRR